MFKRRFAGEVYGFVPMMNLRKEELSQVDYGKQTTAKD
jgi:hypothetical protein